jgi:hypothetical protein
LRECRSGRNERFKFCAALFPIETAKSEIEEAGLPQAEGGSKASDILAETTEKIVQVIGEADLKSK